MEKTKKPFTAKALEAIEIVGNKLPSPIAIFMILTVAVILISGLLANAGTSVLHPGTGEYVYATNLMSVTSLQEWVTNALLNFRNFPPLHLGLAVMIGAGLASHTKFFETVLKMSVSNVSPKLISLVVIIAGVLGSTASDAFTIALPPLAALLFIGAGRHPLPGIFAAFASVSATLSANPVVNSLDILLQSFTNPAAQLINPDIYLSPAMNYIFMAVSSVILVGVIYFVTEKIVAPRFDGQAYEKDSTDDMDALTQVTDQERRAVKFSLLGVAVFAIILVLLSTIPTSNGYPFLLGEGIDSILAGQSIFMRALVLIVTIFFFIPGFIFGVMTGQIKSSHDLFKLLSKGMSEMGPFIVIAFFASQFISLFAQSNLAVILAVNGANFIQSIGLTGPLLFIAFILLTAMINMVMLSASAQWAIFAPIFIPMFYVMGYSPELTTAIYRIGDSATNIISPLHSYLPLIIVYVSKYKKNVGFGTLFANLLPYTLAIGVVWFAILLVFYFFRLPLGF